MAEHLLALSQRGGRWWSCSSQEGRGDQAKGVQPQQLHFPYALGTVAAWECPGTWGMDAGLSSSFRQLPVSCLCCLLGDA